MLAQHGFKQVQFVRGSALRALEQALTGDVQGPATECIKELLAALDQHIPEPNRDLLAPFFMPVEDDSTEGGCSEQNDS